jgi:iron complex outermembrane receptor protein
MSISIPIKPLTWAVLTLACHLAWAQKSPTTDMGQVEITDKRDDEIKDRRESTVSKIVITHEEIERLGDNNIGDVLQRQPGISLGGPPGRGSGIRMRGLSAGYTQILMDGQRMPHGFPVESLTPEMVERIEIYRAPTAETGAQAVAGTINIITRQGKRGEPMDLKSSLASQGGQLTEMVSLSTHQDLELFSANYTLSANHSTTPTHSETDLSREALGPLPSSLSRTTLNDSVSKRDSINATARLQFKDAPGETLTLMPFLMFARSGAHGTEHLSQSSTGNGLSGFDEANTQSLRESTVLRLNGQWKKVLSPDSNFELKFNGGGWNSYNNQVQTAGRGGILPSTNMTSTISDRSFTSSLKFKQLLSGGHEWVSGVEMEQVIRAEDAYATPALMGNTGDLGARQWRSAFYTQDEWQINPQWGTYAGLRYEHLDTHGNNGLMQSVNQSTVLSPMLHAMWRPEPDSKDQVRMSLTRSYKATPISSLMAPYLRTSQDSTNGSNGPSDPDTVGNPYLKPELATGLDFALEHYLAEGGILSASVFYRRVDNYVRTLVAQNLISGRWVSSPQNVGTANTEGLELEAKFRLNQLISEAPAVNLRANVSFFNSQVAGLPGPHNQMDQQPHITGNFGGDYRFKGTPLTVGGNYNLTPAYETQTSAAQLLSISRKREFDVYGLWKVDNTTSWRLSLFNLGPQLYSTGSIYQSPATLENSQTHNQTYLNVQLRWEKRL